MTRKRWLGLLVAALLVPLPAFALSGGSASASLSVSVANGGCGVAGGSSVVCRLDVSFSPIEGATSYTATVTSPNGSVVDYGAIGAGGATIPVPYSGDGTYSVTVSAWGKAPDHHHHAKPIATDTAGSVGGANATVKPSSDTRRRGVSHHSADSSVSQANGARDSRAGGSATATVDPNTTTTNSQPDCPPAPPAPPPTTTTTPTTTTPTTTTPGATTTTATPPTSTTPAAPPPPPGCPSTP